MIVLKALLLKTKTSCKTLINYAAALKLFQDHTVYISFYTANAQQTAKLIRLTQICLNYSYNHTKETNATRLAKTFNSEHSNGRIIMCCNPFTFRKKHNPAVSLYKKKFCKILIGRGTVYTI